MQENVRLQGELRERYDFSHILGTSRAMHAVCEQMMQVTRTNNSVLIRGDSGTLRLYRECSKDDALRPCLVRGLGWRCARRLRSGVSAAGRLRA